MVISAIHAASGAAKLIAPVVGKIAAASGAAKFVIPAIGKIASASGAAKFAAVSGAAKVLVPAAVKAAPVAIGATKLTATIATAIGAASTVIGIGKLSILPMLIASLVFYNYDLFDPENRPFSVPQIDREYDFVIVGGGSAGSVLANRLSEISNWKILLLEAGGHETEISDVPILSLYLHKSKLDWKYR